MGVKLIGELHEDMAEHGLMRENEIDSYQQNIDNYNSILAQYADAAAPPQHLVPYALVPIDQLPLAMTDEDVDVIIRHQFYNRIKVLIRTERQQQLVSRGIRDILERSVPDYAERVGAKANFARVKRQVESVERIIDIAGRIDSINEKLSPYGLTFEKPESIALEARAALSLVQPAPLPQIEVDLVAGGDLVA